MPAIQLPPQGTYGREVPKPLQALIKRMAWMGRVMVRRGMRIQGRPLLLLMTTGAKSGKRRETTLAWFPDDERSDSWVVVASNGGSGRHPAWAHNLAKNPDAIIDLGGSEVPVTSELLMGAEREARWNAVVAAAPGYGPYVETTDRLIPIFRLTRRVV